MKKTKRMSHAVISFVLVLSMLLTICSVGGASVVYAIAPEDEAVPYNITETEKIELDNYATKIEDFVEPVFGDRQIASCQYMYNLDDSADYICVEFETGGYAIYAKETMEMLEYNPQGSLPYDSTAKKYYAGPTNYLQKENDQFHNVMTGERIILSETEIKSFSEQARVSVINEAVTKYETDTMIASADAHVGGIEDEPASSSAPIEGEGYIDASLTSGYLIPNYKFFTADPEIGENIDDGSTYGNGNTGTCGSIAAQLLLAYHNFFSDRRIIPDRFLYGYDDDAGKVIESLYHRNPNYCTDPMSMTSYTTGTRSEPTGDNSFYVEMITRIMEPNTEGAYIDEVYDGMDSYLKDREAEKQMELNYTLYYREEKNIFGVYSTINSALIRAELDAGRPLIINIKESLGACNHYVIGYGYQNYTYPDGSGTYSGYVVHYGYENDYTNNQQYTCVWINSLWCSGYISLKFNHAHDYYTVGTIPSSTRTEYKCSTCGHRTDAVIFMQPTDRYVEKVVTLSTNESKEYYITCKSEGAKLIQTFGTLDTKMYLYDHQHNLLASNDDGGYSLNSLLSYYMEANTSYIIRIEFYSNATAGNTRLGIIPAYGSYVEGTDIIDAYEDIYAITNYTSFTYQSFAQPGYTRVLTFTPPSSGSYDFGVYSNVDAFIYVIDPRSVAAIVDGVDYDDDGAALGLDALLIKDLTAGIPYLVIYTNADPSVLAETVTMTVKILKN